MAMLVRFCKFYEATYVPLVITLGLAGAVGFSARITYLKPRILTEDPGAWVEEGLRGGGHWWPCRTHLACLDPHWRRHMGWGASWL